LYGNDSDDRLYGSNYDNWLYGGLGSDYLYGGGGNDTFVFDVINSRGISHSLISKPDHISDFTIGKDKILLRKYIMNGRVGIFENFRIENFTHVADSTATTLEKMVNSVFDHANGNFGKQPLDKNSAALVSVTTAGIAGTYLVINDGITGFQSNQDLVVNLTGYIGTLPGLGSIDNVNSFFV
jgi:Ca2+-binding RTX toxin-like protein